MAKNTGRAACLAAELLLDQKLYSPRIDIASLCYSKNIIFDTFTNFCRNSRASLNEILDFGGIRDGCTIRRDCGGNSLYIVLYNEKISPRGRRNFTLAHEVGHIYLGHEHDEPCEEAEADCFASHLILPPVLVWEVMERSGFTLSAYEIAGIFGASKAAAENRLRSLKRRRIPEFLAAERLLLDKFGGLLPQLDGPLVDC